MYLKNNNKKAVKQVLHTRPFTCFQAFTRTSGSGKNMLESIPGIIPFDKLATIPTFSSDSKFEPISGSIPISKAESKSVSSSGFESASVFSRVESVSLHSQKSSGKRQSKSGTGKTQTAKVETITKSQDSKLESGVIPGIIPYDKLDDVIPKSLQGKTTIVRPV